MTHNVPCKTDRAAPAQWRRDVHANCPPPRRRRPILRLGLGLIALLAAGYLLPAPAAAESGPFAQMKGEWAGTGTLRPKGGAAERIRCTAHYRPIGAKDVELELRCASDSYNFDLTGKFWADERNHIGGYWTERKRGVSGAIAGAARGNRLQVRAESPGFSARLNMVTRGRRQSITIDSKAGTQDIDASINLHRR